MQAHLQSVIPVELTTVIALAVAVASSLQRHHLAIICSVMGEHTTAWETRLSLQPPKNVSVLARARVRIHLPCCRASFGFQCELSILGGSLHIKSFLHIVPTQLQREATSHAQKRRKSRARSDMSTEKGLALAPPERGLGTAALGLLQGTVTTRSCCSGGGPVRRDERSTSQGTSTTHPCTPHPSSPATGRGGEGPSHAVPQRSRCSAPTPCLNPSTSWHRQNRAPHHPGPACNCAVRVWCSPRWVGHCRTPPILHVCSSPEKLRRSRLGAHQADLSRLRHP